MSDVLRKVMRGRREGIIKGWNEGRKKWRNEGKKSNEGRNDSMRGGMRVV